MTALTIVGNLTGDPELRFTPSGKAVANFSVAHTPRYFDRQASEWRDGETMFLRCSIWSDSAEHVAASLKRGHRVVVLGRLKARSFEVTDEKTGEVSKRTVFELDADEVGPSLRFAECDVRKATRPEGSGSGSSSVGAGGDGSTVDPWAVPAVEQSSAA